MSDKEESTTVETFDVMPGADRPMDDDIDVDMDLSFDTPPEEPVVAEAEAEEPTAEVEEAVEETVEVAEAEGDDDEPNTDVPPVEEEVPEEVQEPLPLAAEAEEKPQPKQPMVPKSRLDEVLQKQKVLQKQIEEMNAQKAAEEKAEAPEEYDFDAKEVEYQNLVLDGESQKAASLRREIRAAERAQIEYEFNEKVTNTVTKDREMSALQQAATTMQDAYPVFDPNSDQFDEGVTNEVVELRNAFISSGYNVVEALSKAANFVIKDRGLDAAEAPAGEKPNIAQPVDEIAKKRAEVSKKLKAAQAQPPELPGESAANHGEKALDIAALTEEEFDALPEATLKRLRGDIL